MPGDDATAAAAVDAWFDDAPCGLAITGSDGRIEQVNRTLCDWLGIARAELTAGRRFQDLLSVGGRLFYQTHFAPLLQLQGALAEIKLDLVAADGTRLPTLINAICRDGGRVMFAVFVAKDRHAYERELVLARRRAEEAAERERAAQDALREADRRKDEFLAMLAHELRNPLAPVAAAAQVLRRAPADREQVERGAAVIVRQIEHLTRLVDDLLDVSRVTRGVIALSVVPVDLAEAVHAAVEQTRPLIDARDHALHVDTRPGCIVHGDRTRLVQAVANLLTNAARYTPPGGRIDVRMSAAADGVQVEVADTGIGIDAPLLPHLFELFSQAERTSDRGQGGLGIGLALVRSLVSLHGGHVDAHSEGPGHGSRFRIWLPLPDRVDAAAPAPDEPPRDDTGARPLQVLVVDDNRDAGLTLGELLRLVGHEPQVVGTAAEALAKLSQRAPDVCILDIGLPDLSGHALAERIRVASGPHPPLLIALTGYGQPADRARSAQAGFDHHLVKPVDADALLALIDAHARQRG